MFLSPPAGTKMFQFPAFAPAFAGARSSTWRVSPFGHPRINSCLPIPAAFRSLPRPSSPIEAKASPVRSSFLRLESCQPPSRETNYAFWNCSPLSDSEKLLIFLTNYLLLTVFITSLSLSTSQWTSRSGVPHIVSSETDCKGSDFFLNSKFFW